jgi:hypothetical protein
LVVNRSTATVSSQLSVASSRIRFATGAQSVLTPVMLPAMPVTRRASARRLPARIIILVGMHAQ